MKLMLLVVLVLTVACGKDKSSSSSNVFGSQYGVAQTAEAFVVMPRAGQAGQLYIEAGGRQYQLGQVQQQAQMVLQQMAQGMYQPYVINTQIVKFRCRVTATPSAYGYGGGVGYPNGGYQQPVNSNILDVQAIQPY
ncbi:MAG: hypothetical protein K2P81_05575 [Bacteriovoracaceae bacterium]|nr:hypothetical protein [Bacteriovoracaceae bacterium]